MENFKEIDAKEISGNFIKKIGDEWLLITAGDKSKFNTMTASWGGVGVFCGKNVAYLVIRPQRYTFEFVEKNPTLTLSFFSEDYRKALQICGSKSGRDCDKVKEAGLTAIATESGNMTFAEASLVMECTKMYAQTLNEASFIDKSLVEKWFKAGDYHKLYICQIDKCWEK